MREPPIIIHMNIVDNAVISSVHNNDLIQNIDEFYDEIIQFISTGNSKSGVVYSHKSDNYFYINNLLDDNTSVFMFSISIVDAVSFYYLKSRIDRYIIELFKDTKNITDKIINFENFLNRINLGNKIDLYSNIFDNDLFDFMIQFFENSIDLVIYALLLEIPIIIENVSENKDHIKDQFLSFIPELNILNKEQSLLNNFYHIIITETSNTSYYHDQLVYNSITKEIKYRFECPSIITKLVDEAIDLHKDTFIPFNLSIYVKILWSVNKVFGIIALNKDEINFQEHLLDEEQEFLEIFNKLYLKLGYNKQLLVS